MNTISTPKPKLFSTLGQICKLIPVHLVSRLARQTGVEDKARIRDAINLEMIRTQNEGLRRVLRRSDRAVVAARIDGELIGATVAATDLLKAISLARGITLGRTHPNYRMPPVLTVAQARKSFCLDED